MSAQSQSGRHSGQSASGSEQIFAVRIVSSLSPDFRRSLRWSGVTGEGRTDRLSRHGLLLAWLDR